MVEKDGVTPLRLLSAYSMCTAVFVGHSRQVKSLFDIGIWVVPRFIRPL